MSKSDSIVVIICFIAIILVTIFYTFQYTKQSVANNICKNAGYIEARSENGVPHCLYEENVTKVLIPLSQLVVGP